MPLYKYECEECGRYFDIYSSVEDRHDQYCPNCGSKLTKLISPIAVHIFEPYVDDMMDDKPIYIETRRQKKEELRKRGLEEL